MAAAALRVPSSNRKRTQNSENDLPKAKEARTPSENYLMPVVQAAMSKLPPPPLGSNPPTATSTARYFTGLRVAEIYASRNDHSDGEDETPYNEAADVRNVVEALGRLRV
jgi:hypothetical protein